MNAVTTNQTEPVPVAACTILDRRAVLTMIEAMRATGLGRDTMIVQNLIGRGSRGDLAIEPGTATTAGNVLLD